MRTMGGRLPGRSLARSVGMPLFFILALAQPQSACAGPWHVEYGFGLNGLFGTGDMSSVAAPAFGADLGLNVVNETGGLGLRAQFGAMSLGSDEIQTSGAFLWWPVSGTYKTSQMLGRLAAGPSWSIPGPSGRGEFYLLGGSAWSTLSGEGMLVNVSGDEPQGGSTWTAILGGAWCIPLKNAKKKGISLEVDGEIHTGGRLKFWGDPAFIPDGVGGATYQSQTASIGGFALRVGFNFQPNAR